MCGISGFNWSDEEKIGEMTSTLSHRGPDATGKFVGDGVSLGHNRLAVIDLSADANQPMFDESREHVIIFNGEIYNFEEVKKELTDYSFKTKSDTEVILAGYKKWGKEVVKKLNGMYALAIWNTKTKELFCARDHAGMKPFYYFWDGTRFIFASEIRAILKHDIPRRLNREAFNHYMRVLYTPEPMTMIENVYKLPPRGILTLSGGTLRIETWSEEVSKTELSYGEAKKALRSKVIEAVNRHLVSDVPVGVYLSGGIDSSTTLFAMSQVRKDIETFTIGFDENDPGVGEKFNQDFLLAKKTAEFFGTNHHEVSVSAQSAIDAFDFVVKHNSDPVSNPTAIAMALLARFARKNVTVALTGNGGDELFGGYDRYRRALAAHYYKKLPGFVRAIGNIHPKLRKLDYRREVDFLAQVFFEKDKKVSSVVEDTAFISGEETKNYFHKKYFSSTNEDLAARLMNTDEQSWLPDHFFMLSDHMSMASALEERMPFLDREVVRFAHSLPRSYKLDLFQTKMILKDTFKNDLPSFLFSQPKRGWFSPAAKWLRIGVFSDMARSMFSSEYHPPITGLFNWGALSEMLEKHIKKEEYNLTTLWAALTFIAWAKEYKITL